MSARVAEQRTHELHVLPELWYHLALELRTFEIRRDEGFRAGDLLHLREWHPLRLVYTGRECWREVNHVLTASKCYGMKPGFVAMSIRPLRAPPDLRPNRMRPVAADPPCCGDPGDCDGCNP